MLTCPVAGRFADCNELGSGAVLMRQRCLGAGALLAVSALQQHSTAGVMCLRAVNPHVAAALQDWGAMWGTLPSVPRQLGTAALLSQAGTIAGDLNASFLLL